MSNDARSISTDILNNILRTYPDEQIVLCDSSKGKIIRVGRDSDKHYEVYNYRNATSDIVFDALSAKKFVDKE